MILGSMEGVSRHGIHDKGCDIYRLVTLIVRDSSSLVLNTKKVFERPLHHTRRKIRADLAVLIFNEFHAK